MGKDQEAQEEFKVSQLAKGIEKHQHSHRSRLDRALNKTEKTETPVGLRRRGKHRAKITIDDQLEIAKKAILDCEPVRDLAKEYRVSQSRISNIISQARKKPEILRERISREAEKAERNEDLVGFIEDKLQSGEVVQRAEDVKLAYEAETGISFKVHQIRSVMKDLLGLRYNKIVPLPVHGNSERCLVQRQ